VILPVLALVVGAVVVFSSCATEQAPVANHNINRQLTIRISIAFAISPEENSERAHRLTSAIAILAGGLILGALVVFFTAGADRPRRLSASIPK
jgi:hypothetical protein